MKKSEIVLRKLLRFTWADQNKLKQAPKKIGYVKY